MERIILDGTNLQIDTLVGILESRDIAIDIPVGYTQSVETDNKPTEHIVMEFCTTGEFYDKEIGMLSLVLLLNHCIKIGFNKGFVDTIIDFVDNGIYPLLHIDNISDLDATDELISILLGDKKTICMIQSEVYDTDKLAQKYKISKSNLSSDELKVIRKLCLVSTSLAVFSLKEAMDLAKTADICTAMNLEGIRGELGAFDSRLHEVARPYENQAIASRNIRRMVEGSDYTTERGRMAYGGDKGPRCQDAISVRATPQTHGGVRDTILWLSKNLSDEINSLSSEINPLIGYSIDLMLIALADLGNISERRSFRLNDSYLSYGLPMNLVGDNPGFNHGFPVIHASATAILAELKLLAMPYAGEVINDSYKCNTFPSALRALEAVGLLGKVLAIEMLMTAQAMSLAKDKLSGFKFGKGTQIAFDEFRKSIKVTRGNRFAAPDMVSADRLVADKSILCAVESAIGKLK